MDESHDVPRRVNRAPVEHFCGHEHGRFVA